MDIKHCAEFCELNSFVKYHFTEFNNRNSIVNYQYYYYYYIRGLKQSLVAAKTLQKTEKQETI